jgi:hypothetical protein
MLRWMDPYISAPFDDYVAKLTRRYDVVLLYIRGDTARQPYWKQQGCHVTMFKAEGSRLNILGNQL